MARVTVVEFPGSSAEEVREAYLAISESEVTILWHDAEQMPPTDLLVIPGGSSFCDYLRPGALAKSSPAAIQIRKFARAGRVLGIGNGFQILCELGVLPGAFTANIEAKFIAEEVTVTAQESVCQLLPETRKTLKFPLACEYGRFQIDTRLYAELESNRQIAFQYTTVEGLPDESPPTGSVRGIAGITNELGNVLGVMFHPERSVEERFGGIMGRELLLSALPR